MLAFLKSILFIAALLAGTNGRAQRENPQHATDTVYRQNRAKGDTSMEKQQPPPKRDTLNKRTIPPLDSIHKQPGSSRTDTIYRKIPPREGK